MRTPARPPDDDQMMFEEGWAMTGMSDSSGMIAASAAGRRIAARTGNDSSAVRPFETEGQRDADDDLVQPDAHAQQRHDQRHRAPPAAPVRKAQPQRPE